AGRPPTVWEPGSGCVFLRRGDRAAGAATVSPHAGRLYDGRPAAPPGAVTQCAQPTPRWQVASGSVTLNLNDYAVAKGTTLRVKGVPVMYLPMIYYPIREDQRSTRFLRPTYGTSTVRGQAISNAFFWAINRSTDATFFHDWFTKAGQGAGAEYRYVAAAQSMGDVRFYRFNQDATTFVGGDQTQTLQKANSYEVTGNLNHALTRNIRA